MKVTTPCIVGHQPVSSSTRSWVAVVDKNVKNYDTLHSWTSAGIVFQMTGVVTEKAHWAMSVFVPGFTAGVSVVPAALSYKHTPAVSLSLFPPKVRAYKRTSLLDLCVKESVVAYTEFCC